MKWWKVSFLLLLAFQSSGVRAQSISMIKEPVVTQGTSNRVFSEQVFGAKTFLFRIASSATWDTIASSGNPNQYFEDIGGLNSGTTYEYAVLFAGNLSNIVSSTQDNDPPVVNITLPGDFLNQNSFLIPFSTYDTIAKSVKRAYLYYRPGHNQNISWRLYAEKKLDSTIAAIPATPLQDGISFLVPDTLGDGAYEFYIATRDTAWAPEHRPDQPFVGEEGNRIIPLATTAALKQLFVDTHQPTSGILSNLNRMVKSAAVTIEFSAKDSSTGHHGYLGSGINQVALYVNYKSDPQGAYLYQDSLYAVKRFSSPLLAVAGGFNFTAAKDGYYEFYTLASDTAQNVENNGQPKTQNLPYIEVDTAIPLIDSIKVTAKNLDQHPAKPGWTRNRMVGFRTFGVADPPKDGYSSGLDSILIAENLTFDKNIQKFPAVAGTVEGDYQLTDVAEEKTVYALVTDHAGNTSIPRSRSITYDPQSPAILAFHIPFLETTQKSLAITVSFQDNFSLDSLFLWRDGALIAADSLPGTNQYQADIPVTLPDQLGWHYFSAQIRDKAGNLSTLAEDSVKLSTTVSVSNVQLMDLSPPGDPYGGADPGYSDSSVVAVHLDYQGSLLKLQFSEDPSFTVLTELFPPWDVQGITGGDTTIRAEFTFGPGEGAKTLYVRGFGPQLSDTSVVRSAGITIDTGEPQLSAVAVYHALAPGDTTFQYTNSRTVHVKLQSSDEDLARMVFWEDGLDSVLFSTFTRDTTYSLKSPDDGLIQFHARIRDHAGNWSSPFQTAVYLDRRLPVMDSLYFTSRFSSTFTATIHLVSHDDTLFSHVGALGKVRFSEDNSFPPDKIQEFTLPEQVAFSGPFSLQLTPIYGEHTMWAQVRDRAGNWSNTLSARVKVVEIVQPMNLLLQDLTPITQTRFAAFPGWSNSDTVQAEVSFQGVLRRILASRDPTMTSGVVEIDTWTTLNDSTVRFNYDFGSVQGQAELFVQLIGPNLPDTSQVISARIQIDKTPPGISELSIFQVHPSGDTTFAFSNSREISVAFRTPSEPLTHSLIWETPADSQFYQLTEPLVSYTFDSDVNEPKMVHAIVRDSAGNWSPQVYTDGIILDSTVPQLSRILISDRSKAGVEDSVLTDELTVEITFQASDPLPGKLYRVLVGQSEDLTRNQQEFLFNTGQIQIGNNQLTLFYPADKSYFFGNVLRCWMVVEDSARNRSTKRMDDIRFTEQLRIRSTLYDLADPGDSLYTRSAKVGLRVKEVSGIYEEVAFSETQAGLTNWQPVTSGQVFTTEYTFPSSSVFFVGRLYVAARNSAGQFTLDSTSITIDKTKPTIQSVTLVAVNPAGDEEYSNKQDVKVRLVINDTGALSQIQLSEDSVFTSYQSIDVLAEQVSSYQAEVDFKLSPVNGTKTVYVRAMDAAENMSDVSWDQIIADYDPTLSLTNHPNPFNPNVESTTLIVKTPGTYAFEVNIYDLFGNHVRKIRVPPGERYNQVIWDGKNGKGEIVANGGYICVVQVESKTLTRKIAVIK